MNILEYTRSRRLATLLLVIALAGCSASDSTGVGSGPGRPWDIETLDDGSTRVLGLRPGSSTMREILALYGPRVDAALLRTRGESLAAVEAYYSQVTVGGGLRGRLILVLDVDESTLEILLARSPKAVRLATGTVRHEIALEDGAEILDAPARVITFVPAPDLEESVLIARFGEPAERVTGQDGQIHLLYPELGLDVVADPSGKALIQYVHPGAFHVLVAELPTGD